MVDESVDRSAEEDAAGDPAIRPPLVFISHDTRDAALAEAFSKLLGNVSAGVLKSFRSSDKSGKQGIAYGVEWFPEIMRNMQMATDVVCLLTSHSVDRPWILFEAGVAKGKLDTPILGVALGIPLSAASAGPFAQFQNSDDDEESLLKLVRQLVSKIPNAEPSDEVIRPQVVAFMSAVEKIIGDAAEEAPSENLSIATIESDARLFEEVKVMFGEIAGRLERLDRPSLGPTARLPQPELIYRLTREAPTPEQGFRMAASALQSALPWLYELAMDALLRVKRARSAEGARDRVGRFVQMAHASVETWNYASRNSRSPGYLHECVDILGESLQTVADMVLDR